MQLDNAEIYLCKDKSSGDAGTALHTGHRGTENLSREANVGAGSRNELPAPQSNVLT